MYIEVKYVETAPEKIEVVANSIDVEFIDALSNTYEVV